jgi:hypothetical protein
MDNTWVIPGLSAKIFLVDLYNTIERRAALGYWAHHFSDGMAHLPGCWLTNANPFGQKYRRYAFA